MRRPEGGGWNITRIATRNLVPQLRGADLAIAGVVHPDHVVRRIRRSETYAPDRIEGIPGERITHVTQQGGIAGTARHPALRKPLEALEGAAGIVSHPLAGGQILFLHQRQRPTLSDGRRGKPTHPDAVAVDPSFVDIECAPDDIVGQGGHEFDAFGVVAAGGGELSLRGARARVLDGAATEINGGQRQSDDGRPRAATLQRQEEAGGQRQGEGRVDDGDQVPAEANVGERPEQMGAVARRGVEEAVTVVGDQRTTPQRKPAPAASGPEQPERGHDGSPQRGKEQRVGEAAVMLDREQRIRRASDEHIDIGNERRQAAGQRGRPAEPAAKCGVAQARTEDDM